ncbi:MAG TPA: acetyl-CoA C-acetyltransferase [Octadecabacter sp.]|nr:acetyl-CoA C-acetyltransferase [Octadecabacter sp.]
MTDPIVILSAKRTPMGGLGGELSPLTASQLGAVAAKAAVEEAGVSAADVDEVIFGNVLGAGQGQAPARQIAFGAGLPEGAVATTVNKMCGSGMKAAMLAHDLLAAGSIDMALAGGAESMSNAPYLLPKVRDGLRMGHGVTQDHMFTDGLEDAYEKGTLMGVFAERCATDYQFTREAQDAYAIASLERALAAEASGAFEAELAQTDVVTRRATSEVKTDEQPRNARPDKIPQLKPAFAKDGTVTAANASSISDGAAALILTRASVAKAKGLTPIAKITGHTSHGVSPDKFPIAPIGAVEKLLEKTGTTLDDYGLFEVNEAFAVVAMAAMHSLGIPHDKVNVNGGACALGHPIGASGARIMVTLLHAMRARNVQRGMAAICIGGGEATAIGLELMEQS